MGELPTLFIGTFTTLLAVINPLEAMPVFLQLLHGRDEPAHRQVAFRSCLYATFLMFFFLAFGTLIMRLFGVPLSMVRVVGGIILMRLGFELFAPSPESKIIPSSTGDADQGNIAFIPLAMPIMVGPGVIATILGMASLVKKSHYLPLIAIPPAIRGCDDSRDDPARCWRANCDHIGERGHLVAQRLIGQNSSIRCHKMKGRKTQLGSLSSNTLHKGAFI